MRFSRKDDNNWTSTSTAGVITTQQNLLKLWTNKRI